MAGLAAAVLTAAACHNTPAEPLSPTAVVLQPGVNIAIPQAGLGIQLVRVDNESRCPSNVTCVWAGNAEVVVAIGPFPGCETCSIATQVLNTNIEPRSRVVNGYRVMLDSLTPYPVAPSTIPQASYRAYVTVTFMKD